METTISTSTPGSPPAPGLNPVLADSALAAPSVRALDRDAAVLLPLEDEGSLSVGLWEVIRTSFDSLLANKMRSFLTMLGVIIGVASVVALMAVGNGASAAITGRIQSLGTNVLTIMPGSPNNQGPGNALSAQTLTLADANAISALNLPVVGIAPQFEGNAQIVASKADQNAMVVGTTASYQVINNLTLAAGSFFSEDQVRSSASVVVLGADVATELFGGSGQAVGQTVRIQSQTLRVIGVLKATGGGGFGSVDNRAFVPIGVAQQRLFDARTPDGNGYRVSSISVSAKNAADLDAIQARITTLLRQRHNLKTNGSADDFRVMNQTQFLDTLSNTTTLLTALLTAIGSISLLVGGIGIMNIMLVSVTERTHEIGLRKAVGAGDQAILMQFIAEALVISLMGGLIGLAVGSAVAKIMTLTGLLTTVVSLNAVLIAVGFSLAVGLFFGIYPARRAAQLNPIDALRYE